jgi:hypothetical protein
MVVALAYRKRAIPLAWRCYHQEQRPCSQVELICSLLQQVRQGVPCGVLPLVQADRGIGTSPQLAMAVQQMGWHFLFRVQGQCRVWLDGTDAKASQPIKTLAHRGSTCCVSGRVFKKAARHNKEGAWLPCRVFVKWPGRYEEPWCLITNSPDVSAAHYAMRAWEEQGFRDLKSGGWQWHRSRIWTPAHAERLVLAMAIAYAFILTLGTTAISTGKQAMRQITRGRQRGQCHHFSAFRLGLRYLSHLCSITRPKPLPLHLLLIPTYPSC